MVRPLVVEPLEPAPEPAVPLLLLFPLPSAELSGKPKTQPTSQAEVPTRPHKRGTKLPSTTLIALVYSSSSKESSSALVIPAAPPAPAVTVVAMARFFSCSCKMRSSTVSLATMR